MSDDLIERLRARHDKWQAKIAEWRAMAPSVWTDELAQQLSPTIEAEAADALAAKDTAISEMRAELENLRDDAKVAMENNPILVAELERVKKALKAAFEQCAVIAETDMRSPMAISTGHKPE